MLGADREPVASMDLQLRGQPHVHLTNWHCLGVHIVAVVAFLFLVEANLGHHIPEMADMVAAVRKPRGAVRFLSGDNNSQNHDLAGNAEGWMDPNHILNHGPLGVKQKPFQADAGEKLAHFHHWPHPKLNYPHQQEVQFCDSVPLFPFLSNPSIVSPRVPHIPPAPPASRLGTVSGPRGSRSVNGGGRCQRPGAVRDSPRGSTRGPKAGAQHTPQLQTRRGKDVLVRCRRAGGRWLWERRRGTTAFVVAVGPSFPSLSSSHRNPRRQKVNRTRPARCAPRRPPPSYPVDRGGAIPLAAPARILSCTG
ncbi:hypothetical protein BHM03_00034472 [Ensete ventricosum]|nr:hypothetical protein BHM03_00034472 [Ensete ventricosum]